MENRAKNLRFMKTIFNNREIEILTDKIRNFENQYNCLLLI